MKLYRQSKNTSIIILAVFIFSLALLHNSYSQDADRYLEIKGTAELDMKPVSNAVVTLYEGNSKIKSIKTGSSGMFSFKLDMNKDYTVEVAKEGYMAKRIRFITKIPDDVTGAWVREFAVGLVKYCEGVNYSVLNDPVDVIQYSLRRQDFDSDKTFVYKVKPRLENLYIDVDQCLIKKYNSTLSEADRLLDNKKYDEAREKYEQAKEMLPDEQYPDDQISKINDIINRDRNIENLYKNTIAEADALFTQKRYDEALLKYKGALTLKPQETYSEQKISEIESLKAELDAQQQAKSEEEAKYNSLISKGNTAYALKNYEMARDLYSQALEIKPGNYYPTNKLKELNVLIAQKEQTETRQQEIVKEYNNTVSQADQLFSVKNYEQAKELYNKALLVNPNENYPKEKIAEIDNMIKEQQEIQVRAKRDAMETEYEEALAEGDNYFKLKEYEAAKAAYSKASSIKPEEYYPKQRIERINNLLAAEQASKQQALEKDYDDAVAAGEKLMGIEQHEQARQEFNKALTFKPDDVYARNKISEIDRLIEIQKQRLAEETARDEQYRAAITKADGAFKIKEFDNAKTAYQDALNIKPGEQYPRAQIQEIDRLLAIREAEKQREVEDGYKSAVLSGNRLFSSNQYALAKSEYERALDYKPGDSYASSRISEINRIIAEQEQKTAAEQERILAEKKAREDNYSIAISKADGYFRLQEYEKAKAEYNNALVIMPDEIYPKNKISEIDNVIAAQLKAQADARALNDAYDNAVKQADLLFAQKKYEESKSGYTSALNYKPGSAYPREQISKIDNILAQQERIRQEEIARDKEYESLILIADNLYNAADYNNSKENYQKALGIKPDELYPKQKIAKIDEILKQLARQQTNTQTRTQSQSAGQTNTAPKLAELVFKDDTERDRYLNDLKKKYPEGITLETYKEKFKTTRRYIIIRNDEAHEFRMVHFTNWGGKEYSVDGKPITGQYFESQISPRSGEYYKEFEF
jgi:tetratricopeptide (TPR) repeat protein